MVVYSLPEYKAARYLKQWGPLSKMEQLRLEVEFRSEEEYTYLLWFEKKKKVFFMNHASKIELTSIVTFYEEVYAEEPIIYPLFPFFDIGRNILIIRMMNDIGNNEVEITMRQLL